MTTNIELIDNPLKTVRSCTSNVPHF